MTIDQTGIYDSLGDLLAVGDVVAGKYRIVRLIGKGGMGAVLEAWHLHFEERVAIKVLLPEVVANAEVLGRFEREARAAFKIKSEHVARVIDVDKLPTGQPYMVMEYLQGSDLADLLAEGRSMPVLDAVDYILQACEAVAEAHAAGIVHRDLKPENLFLVHRADGTPCVKVLDFGLSKFAAGGSSGPRERALTAQAQVMGTPQYMSPEQWMSSKDVGPATDIWALGVLLYELCTGRQPFAKEHVAQLCTMVLQQEPPPMSQWRADVPPGLEQVVHRCLRKEPGDRYPSVAHLALRLCEFGPRRGRESAQRISAVMKTAGVETTEELVPPTLALPPAPLALALPPRLAAGHPLAETQVMSDSEHAIADEPPVARPSYPEPARRADTAQSWQHMLGPGTTADLDVPARSRGKALLIGLSGAAAVVAVVAGVLLTRQDDAAAPAAPAPAADSSAGEPNDVPGAAVDQDGGPTEPGVPASATASAAASASSAAQTPASADGGPTKKTTTGKPVLPSTPRRSPHKNRPKQHRDIFDGR